MRRFFLAPHFSIFVFFVLLTSSFVVCFAQTTKPTVTPTPTEDDDIVKISTTLIQVDVTVTDKKGKIVTDLKPEDFEVYENGKKQEITNFSFISSESKTKTTTNIKSNKNEINTPYNPIQLRSEDVSRTMALVVDDLGISFENMYYVKRALKKFVDEQMQPNDLVAIIRTGGGSGMLQQFTSDKKILHMAIQKISWNPVGRAGISSFIPFQKNINKEAMLAQNFFAGDAEARRRNFDQMKENFEQEESFLKRSNITRNNNFTIGVLGSINSVVDWMSKMPSKKSIILFSDGFQICASPEQLVRDGKQSSAFCDQMTDSLRQLTEFANRSSITIYTQDSRGLATTNLSAEDSFTASADPSEFQRTLRSAASRRDAEVSKKQEGLAYIANETGGRAFFNNNDFNQSFTQILEDQKGYYLIGYQPNSDFFDKNNSKFNKLVVKVNRPDSNVRYRSGFFGATNAENEEVRSSQKSQTPAQKIMGAVVSPLSINEINIKLNSLFTYNDKVGSYINNLVFIDPKDLTFTDDSKGNKRADFNILALVINEDGNIVDFISKTHDLTIKKDIYQKILKEGFVYTFTFPIKEAKFHQIRIAIQDKVSSKLGSANQFLEIPNLKNRKLALSSFNLENYTTKEWNNLLNNVNLEKETDPFIDTANKQFKKETILTYGVEIYNAKIQQNTTQLKTRIRLFKDGKLFSENDFEPLIEQPVNGVIAFKGAFNLGKQFTIGEYVLQLIVLDSLAKEKEQTLTQWVQFEIVD